ncbi:MAG TPA: sensor histidine kinase [Sphingobacteriaceae bacterium]|nr:sensor histidine kinase [Sphingobacteriaceae bacterium]
MVASVCFLVSGFIGYKVVAFILLVTVSLIAMFFDIWPVLLSALLSALIWDLFFIPPRFTFYIGATEDRFILAMYFVIALINAMLTYKIRQIEKVAREKEEKVKTGKLYNVLLNSLSHELKTPIATIIGATDNLLADTNKLSEENKYNLVSEISIASVRLNQQVENLLNMSRLESGYIQLKKDWVDVNELIYSVVNRLEDKLKSHQLKIQINEKLPLFKLDYGLMEPVLYNLISNAILYTEPNSIITITADSTLEVKGHFDENFSSQRDEIKNCLLLDISDNGKGFPPDEIKNVFNKFYRLKNSKTGGTGLGLSIARGFVEAHNGTIHLSNLPKGGANFSIRIPAEMSYLKQTEK